MKTIMIGLISAAAFFAAGRASAQISLGAVSSARLNPTVGLNTPSVSHALNTAGTATRATTRKTVNTGKQTTSTAANTTKAKARQMQNTLNEVKNNTQVNASAGSSSSTSIESGNTQLLASSGTNAGAQADLNGNVKASGSSQSNLDENASGKIKETTAQTKDAAVKKAREASATTRSEAKKLSSVKGGTSAEAGLSSQTTASAK